MKHDDCKQSVRGACRLKALIAEDNPGFRLALEKLLKKWGYDAVAAVNGKEALEVLSKDDPPRLAILDWMMPELDGVEVCRRVREQNREPYIYILLLTAKDTAEELIEGMEAGADEYLRKPVNTQELRVRLRAGRRIIDLQEELVRARELLRKQASRDCLTEFFNRGSMFEVLIRELKRAERESVSLSLIMTDLDHFKEVNDKFGHAAGDAVLREAARRMAACVRPYDAPCRYGGEEFVIVMPGCGLDDAIARAEDIRAQVAATPIHVPEGLVHVTCSVEVTATSGPAGFNSSALLHEVDEALYIAKNKGRNRVEVFAAQPVLAR
ncbi:MAG TPA: diguanylate cyclase [Bryobacteraceae bacterium]|nr:diguanylate cyclase [Bryobacteraceae bacterium]